MLIFFNNWFHVRFCSTLGGLFKRLTCIFYPECDNFYTVTMFVYMLTDW